MESVVKYIQNNRSSFLEELNEFLRIPSVSAKSSHRPHCKQAARFLHERLQRMGLESSLRETEGNPIVLARYTRGNDCPTLLIYGHYDVQPADPVDLWKHPPFEPEIVDGKLYARGATDDKGQLFTHIKAVESYLTVNQELPVNVIFLIEGEEEVASDTLEKFIQHHREELKADAVIISDSAQFGEEMPAICYGLRGICVEEIRVETLGQDLHSGSFGGAVPNPLDALCSIVHQLKDEHGRILIPGFYEDVMPLESWERNAFSELPWDDETFRESVKATSLFGEVNYSTLERRWIRPTLDVNGLYGGYQGEGAKTIIPAYGGAKISMRLVPNQDPEKVDRMFREYVKDIAPPHVEVSFEPSTGCKPVLFPRDTPFMEEARQAIAQGFGKKPVLIREGGSIPVVLSFKEEIEAPVLLLGWGLPSDNPHSPNEKFSLRDFESGTISSAWLLHLCGKKS